MRTYVDPTMLPCSPCWHTLHHLCMALASTHSLFIDQLHAHSLSLPCPCLSLDPCFAAWVHALLPVAHWVSHAVPCMSIPNPWMCTERTRAGQDCSQQQIHSLFLPCPCMSALSYASPTRNSVGRRAEAGAGAGQGKACSEADPQPCLALLLPPPLPMLPRKLAQEGTDMQPNKAHFHCTITSPARHMVWLCPRMGTPTFHAPSSCTCAPIGTHWWTRLVPALGTEFLCLDA